MFWLPLDVFGHFITAELTEGCPRLERFLDFGTSMQYDQFDRFVVPLANAFRPSYERHLVHLTALIEKLDIPVTVIGVGAPAGIGLDADPLAGMADTVRAVVAAVLDRSASVGVRGEFTRSYLVDLGFPADSIDIIGCPSLFTYGDSLRVHKASTAIGPDKCGATRAANRGR